MRIEPGSANVTVSWGENSAAAVKVNSRTIEVTPSSPKVVELESVSAKDLRSLMREKKQRRQVIKEKEKATKALTIPVPVIEISDEEDNDEDEVFERHWSSKICNECGSSVRFPLVPKLSNFNTSFSADSSSATHSLSGIQVCMLLNMLQLLSAQVWQNLPLFLVNEGTPPKGSLVEGPLTLFRYARSS